MRSHSGYYLADFPNINIMALVQKIYSQSYRQVYRICIGSITQRRLDFVLRQYSINNYEKSFSGAHSPVKLEISDYNIIGIRIPVIASSFVCSGLRSSPKHQGFLHFLFFIVKNCGPSESVSAIYPPGCARAAGNHRHFRPENAAFAPYIHEVKRALPDPAAGHAKNRAGHSLLASPAIN